MARLAVLLIVPAFVTLDSLRVAGWAASLLYVHVTVEKPRSGWVVCVPTL